MQCGCLDKITSDGAWGDSVVIVLHCVSGQIRSVVLRKACIPYQSRDNCRSFCFCELYLPAIWVSRPRDSAGAAPLQTHLRLFEGHLFLRPASQRLGLQRSWLIGSLLVLHRMFSVSLFSFRQICWHAGVHESESALSF